MAGTSAVVFTLVGCRCCGWRDSWTSAAIALCFDLAQAWRFWCCCGAAGAVVILEVALYALVHGGDGNMKLQKRCCCYNGAFHSELRRGAEIKKMEVETCNFCADKHGMARCCCDCSSESGDYGGGWSWSLKLGFLMGEMKMMTWQCIIGAYVFARIMTRVSIWLA